MSGDSNTIVISTFNCSIDSCAEPTKRRIGFGTVIEAMESSDSVYTRHVNTYCCDNVNCPKRRSNH